MPISGFAPHEPTLTHEHVYDISKTVLNESFDGFEINGYKYSNNEVWDVLLYASANRLSIKGDFSTRSDLNNLQPDRANSTQSIPPKLRCPDHIGWWFEKFKLRQHFPNLFQVRCIRNLFPTCIRDVK